MGILYGIATLIPWLVLDNLITFWKLFFLVREAAPHWLHQRPDNWLDSHVTKE